MPGPETSASGEEKLLPQRNREKDLYASVAMAALIAYVMVRSAFRATVKPLWFDEVCTWIMATLPNASSVWHALERAADAHPPAFYLLESFLDKLIPNQQIAFRIPAILGLGITLWCLFIWLRRRYETGIVFAAVLTPLLTVFYSTYAVEARPYALVTACLAVALVCYDRVPVAGWTVGLALSLAAAEAFHYYALMAMAPFFAAEFLYACKGKIVRWRVWAAIACGVVPLLFCWQLLANIRSSYGQHFWAKPSLIVAAGTYGWLFDIPLYPLTFARTTICAVLLLVCALLFAFWMLLRSVRASANDARFSDGMLIAVFLLLPFVFFVVTKIASGGFTERYAMAAILGLALASGYGLSRLSKRMAIPLVALVTFLFAWQEARFWSQYRVIRHYRIYWQKPVEELVSATGYQDLPVMVTESHDFLQIAYYTDPEWKRRFVSVVDAEAAVKYGMPDGADKELKVLDDLKPLNVMDYADFRRRYPRFLVFSIRMRINDLDLDWWLQRLSDDGYKITALKTDGRRSIYLVDHGEGAN